MGKVRRERYEHGKEDTECERMGGRGHGAVGTVAVGLTDRSKGDLTQPTDSEPLVEDVVAGRRLDDRGCRA